MPSFKVYPKRIFHENKSPIKDGFYKILVFNVPIFFFSAELGLRTNRNYYIQTLKDLKINGKNVGIKNVRIKYFGILQSC
jgi:hypothetical protein